MQQNGLSGILSGKSSGVLTGISSSIRSGKSPGVLSGISSGILYGKCFQLFPVALSKKNGIVQKVFFCKKMAD